MAHLTYYVLFVRNSTPFVPTIEIIKKKYPDSYAFPVSGEIDGIVISRRYIPNSLEFLADREIGNLFHKRKNLAFLYFNTRANPDLVKAETNKDSIILYRPNRNIYEYLIIQPFVFMEKVDRLWKKLYKKLIIHKASTYVAFTKKYAVVKEV